MKYKKPHMEEQLAFHCHPRLLDVARVFAWLFQDVTGKEAVVTRVTDPVEGESGVHVAGRAVDFRDDTGDGGSLATDEEAKEIVHRMNQLFPRADGKVTCLHHVVPGSTQHFHVQIPV